MGSIRTAVFGVLLLAACASPGQILPGEGTTGTPCDQVVPGCDARRLENVVLRGGETDGALVSVDGLDTSGLLSFDQALEAGWKNDYRGDGETVQVILGAADADELRWGTGTNLFYAVKWGGVCPVETGPAGYAPAGPSNCDGVWGTVIDAHTGEFIVSGM